MVNRYFNKTKCSKKVREMIPRHGRQGSEAWQVVVFVFVIADLKNIQAKLKAISFKRTGTVLCCSIRTNPLPLILKICSLDNI